VSDETDLALATLAEAHRLFVENVQGVSLDEALHAAGGYRSILGLAKHTAGWSAVYYSYAFEPEPRHWEQTDWPRGLREQIAPEESYVAEIIAWFERSYERWLSSVGDAEDLGSPRPLHWGQTLPLRGVVVMVAGHWTYHAGEINAILAAARGEAWEYGEEVEENHISTTGHGVRPPWWDDERAAAHESKLQT
jgi:hypothetical protein